MVDFTTIEQMTKRFADIGDATSIQDNNDAGRMGWNAGSPVETQIDSPPFRIDFNGVLQRISSNVVAYAAGKMWKFSSAFSAAVGGYALGSLVASASNLHLWLSTKNLNTTDPESGVTADWVQIGGFVFTANADAGSYTMAGGFTVKWGTALNVSANNIPFENGYGTPPFTAFYQAFAVPLGSSEPTGSFGTDPGTIDGGLSSLVIYSPNTIAQNVRWLAFGKT